MEPARDSARFSSPYRFVILAAALFVVFAAIGLARFGYSMLLPFMEKTLPLTKEQGGLLASANLLGYLILSLAAGFLSARFGAKKTIVIALGATALALAATALARDFYGALAARFLTGLASGGANVPVMALLAGWFRERERGLASGLAVGGTSVGVAVAGAAVPFFVSAGRPEGWPGAWLLFSLLSALVFVIALVCLRNRPRPAPETAGPAPASGVPVERTALRLAAVIPQLFAARGFVLLALTYFLYGFSYIIYATFFVNFLIQERAFDGSAAGNLWLLLGVASIASGLVWGLLSDWIGRARALLIIYVLMAAAYAFLGWGRALPWIYVSAFLFALCSWSVPAVMSAAAGDLLGHERAPMGFGILTFAFGLGQALGPALAGVLARATGSYAPGFILAAAVSLAGGVLFLFVRTGKKKEAKGDGEERKK